MNEKDLFSLLEKVASGSVGARDAIDQLKSGPFRKSDLGFANLDYHRALRHKLGEVVYGESKTTEQILAIVSEFYKSGQPVLITRLDSSKRNALREMFKDGRESELGRTFTLNAPPEKNSRSGEPFVAILAAGTSDIGVAEEACEVCVAMGIAFERHYDVGVTGLHRLLERIDSLNQATSLVVIAGMEGALPSVVAGLTGRPLFAVPTSVGYGASFSGLTALLSMLNACAPGVTVVNIDNGFSAAFAACNVVWAVREARDARGRSL
ncbi:MAG: nickel pincer cofactor biosynthesis protein LarB [Bdellovibrionota bacterium]